MKKYILILGLTIVTFQSFGQMNKIVGKWVLTTESYLDTISAGLDEINANFEDYKSGKKILDRQFVVIDPRDIAENDAMEVIIKKQKTKFSMKNRKGNFNHEILYDATNKNYYTTIMGPWESRNLIVEYDPKNDKILLFDPLYDVALYELSRKN